MNNHTRRDLSYISIIIHLYSPWYLILNQFFGFLLYYNYDYTQAGIIKVYLVAIASTLLFYKLNSNWEINLNYLLTFLLALNVFVLIFTVIKNPFSKNYITSYFLAFCFLLLVVSTPFGYITKNKVELKQIFMNVNLYVIHPFNFHFGHF